MNESIVNKPDVPGTEDLVPENFPVAVILESRPSSNRWLDESWQAVGVVVGSRNDHSDLSPRLIHDQSGVKHFLYSGFDVALHVDQCESYYHNLMSETPRCYVVAHMEDYNDTPKPFLVSMSFDEAHAYLEGEDQVYAVDVPAELYRWTEAFVLTYYVPEKRKKRKRNEWYKGGSGGMN